MRCHLRIASLVWFNLLDQFQHCLLCLVCLLQSGDASGLEDVVLSHIRHGYADIGILNVVHRALQVCDLVAYDALGCREPIDRSPNRATLCGDTRDGVVDIR